MLLTVDIGNTNIKLGVFDGNELIASLRLSSSNRKTSDEYYYNVKNMLDKSITAKKISGAIISIALALLIAAPYMVGAIDTSSDFGTETILGMSLVPTVVKKRLV